MLVIFYIAKIVYTCVFMTCSTSWVFMTLTDPWNVCMYVCIICICIYIYIYIYIYMCVCVYVYITTKIYARHSPDMNIYNSTTL